MKTQKFTLTNDQEENTRLIAQAAEIIKHGGLVAFPTETVYGLGGNALDKNAVVKIFQAKKRPNWDPLIVHVTQKNLLQQLIEGVSPLFDTLHEKFMPGALTVLLPKSDMVPDEVTAGMPNVAIRMPSHVVARQLIESAGVPIAAPSANLFTHTSPTTADHVLEDLDGRIDAIIDGGQADIGVESTILDLTTTPPRLLRPGGVTKEAIEAIIGPVSVLTKEAVVDHRLAPGLHIRHYAPRAKVVLVEPTEEAIEQAIKTHRSKRIGVMLPTIWHIGESSHVEVYDWGNWSDLASLTHLLYAGLRKLDSQQVAMIIVPKPESTDLGLALLNRLEKAAAD